MTPVPHHPDGPSSFTDEELDATRQEGDPYADELAGKIFGEASMNADSGSRLGYNKLVDIADLLDSDSELLLLEDSNFAKALKQFPPEFQDYYDPMPAPDWVDVTKLETAAEMWRTNSLAMLGILYAASLPACYLMKNGIPALYQTAKLKDSKYVFQRIYETGLMLDAVMSPGGIELVHDVIPDSHDVFLHSLKESAGGNWEEKDGEFVKVSDDDAREMVQDQNNSPEEQVESHERTVKDGFRVAAARRAFLWGRGYITAKKVRMLHASMRFMLLNPGAMKPRGKGAQAMADKFAKAHGSEPFPADKLGVPVNQEDLAFTLLTFSYLIPRGMEMIGCKVTHEEKEAFLHLWRVVGHVMGVRDDLMTDDWDEAKKLYDRIHKLQAGTSPDGIALTKAVMGFLKTYLPNAFGISDRIPVALIGAQMGEDAHLLFDDRDNAILRSLPTRCSMTVTRLALRFFNRRYERLLAWIPVANRVFGDLLFRASELLVMSWRDEYTRKPFYVPVSVNKWVLKAGVDDEFRERLHDWRQHMFLALGSAVLAMGIMFAAVSVIVILLLFGLIGGMTAGLITGLKIGGIVAIVGLIYSVFEIDVRIPKIFKNRPTIPGVSTRGK